MPESAHTSSSFFLWLQLQTENDGDHGEGGQQTVDDAAQISIRPGGRRFGLLKFSILHELDGRGIFHTLAADQEPVGVDPEGCAGDERVCTC